MIADALVNKILRTAAKLFSFKTRKWYVLCAWHDISGLCRSETEILISCNHCTVVAFSIIYSDF